MITPGGHDFVPLLLVIGVVCLFVSHHFRWALHVATLATLGLVALMWPTISLIASGYLS